MSRQEGVTLLEMLIALSIVALLSALAVPGFAQWLEAERYREAARGIALALRQARTVAVASNRECRVEFDIDEGRYRITKGDRAYGSSNFADVVKGWTTVGKNVTLRRNKNCNSAADLNVEFNPNGTGTSYYVCVMDDGTPPQRQFRVAVKSSITGRVAID